MQEVVIENDPEWDGTDDPVEVANHLRRERDSLRVQLQSCASGVADINRQNEELRAENKALRADVDRLSQIMAERERRTPVLPGNMMITQPAFLADAKGQGFWVDPAERVLERAW